jgi:sulfate transport system substrate-binding protein
MIEKPHFVRRAVATATAAAGLAILAAGCGGSSDAATAAGGSSSSGGSSSGGTQLNLVAYSTPKKAYAALTSAFAQTSAGKGVTFADSFGASGAQSRAVDAGQPADVVAFSTEPDISRLVKDGIVASNWDSGPTQGNVADSVVVMVVRKGNPKHITDWNSLIQPGIKVVTPNPSTSGSARWNILAAYGAQLKQGKTPSQALAYVSTLLRKHTASEPSSASTALQAFTSGEGDVLLDYESDAIAAKKAGDAIQYIVPKQTILIQTPDAVTTKSKHAKQAQAFVNWLTTPQAQTIWAQQGYRPVLKSVLSKYSAQFPTPAQLFDINYLGGWKKVKSQFFDPSTGSITKIEQAAGYPTASS